MDPAELCSGQQNLFFSRNCLFYSGFKTLTRSALRRKPHEASRACTSLSQLEIENNLAVTLRKHPADLLHFRLWYQLEQFPHSSKTLQTAQSQSPWKTLPKKQIPQRVNRKVKTAGILLSNQLLYLPSRPKLAKRAVKQLCTTRNCITAAS